MIRCDKNIYAPSSSIELRTIDSGLNNKLGEFNNFSISDSCTRDSFDHCDYPNIRASSHAFRLLINRLLRNCPPRNFECYPDPCCLTTSIIDLGNATVDNTDRMPFGYCLDRETCNAFYCNIAGGTFHNFSDIVFQDAIITYLKNLANQNRPTCPNGQQASVYSLLVPETVDSRDRCDETTLSDCHNRHWKLEVKYTCGSCNGSSIFISKNN
ncbi:MAG: hypothetical protein HOP11_00580 [Saprospiraceae bacterium]|nr:hypothetical protein [Saprospiraceae bacterium]